MFKIRCVEKYKRVNYYKNYMSDKKPPHGFTRILRKFGIHIEMPKTISEFFRKLFNSFFYINFFALGWMTVYFTTSIIVCAVNIGENLFERNLGFFETPGSFFTVATDACGASTVELLNIHVFSFIGGLIGIYFVWFTHYSLKYHEYPMFL